MLRHAFVKLQRLHLPLSPFQLFNDNETRAILQVKRKLFFIAGIGQDLSQRSQGSLRMQI